MPLPSNFAPNLSPSHAFRWTHVAEATAASVRAAVRVPEGDFKALGHLTLHLETLTWLPAHPVPKPEASQQPQGPAPPATSSCLGLATLASLLRLKHTRLTSAPGTLHVLFPPPQGLCICSLPHISVWLVASAPRGVRRLSPPELKCLLPSTPHPPPPPLQPSV